MDGVFLFTILGSTLAALLAIVLMEFKEGGHKRLKRLGYMLSVMILSELGYILALHTITNTGLILRASGHVDLLGDYIISDTVDILSKLFIIAINIIMITLYGLGRGILYEKLMPKALYKGNLKLIDLILDIDLGHTEKDLFKLMKKNSIILRLKLDVVEAIYDKHRYLNKYTKEMGKDLFIIWEIMYSGLVTQEDLDHNAMRVLHQRFTGKEEKLLTEYRNYVSTDVNKELSMYTYTGSANTRQDIPEYDADFVKEVMLLSNYGRYEEAIKDRIDKELARRGKVYIKEDFNVFMDNIRYRYEGYAQQYQYIEEQA